MGRHDDWFPPEHASVSRHVALGILGAAGAAALVRSNGNDAALAAGAAAPACVVTPPETEGPYFVDERLNRSDLTAGATRPGVAGATPLQLRIAVYRVTDGTCTPMAGATVDVWHADALGAYSDVRELNTAGQKFLRGYQVADRNGVVSFTTIYPGWYAGRAVHVHFKVRTAMTHGTYQELTSQLFMDDALTDAVFATPPYSARGARDVRNAHDAFYDRALLVPLRRAARGYAGTFSVGLTGWTQ